MKTRALVLVLTILAGVAAAVPAQRGPGDLPDLVVSHVSFQQVKSETDAGGHSYWIFKVIVAVKNQGKAAAGPFDVTLERNNGAGGAWQIACPTCTLHVAGLQAGQELALEPRQFNNANDMPSSFRATADSGRKVNETNELNNVATAEFKAAISLKKPPSGFEFPFDLTVVSVTCVNIVHSTNAQNQPCLVFDVVAVVKNNGPGKSPSAPLNIYKTDDWKAGFWPLVKAMTVPELASGASMTFTANGVVHILGKPDKIIMGYVNEIHKTDETNTNNNMVWILIPGA